MTIIWGHKEHATKHNIFFWFHDRVLSRSRTGPLSSSPRTGPLSACVVVRGGRFYHKTSADHSTKKTSKSPTVLYLPTRRRIDPVRRPSVKEVLLVVRRRRFHRILGLLAQRARHGLPCPNFHLSPHHIQLRMIPKVSGGGTPRPQGYPGLAETAAHLGRGAVANTMSCSENMRCKKNSTGSFYKPTECF